jgi:predicted permease
MELFGISIIGVLLIIATWIVSVGIMLQAIKNRKNPAGVVQISKFLYFGVCLMHVSNLLYGISKDDIVMMIGSSMSSTAALYVFYQLIWYPKKYSKT